MSTRSMSRRALLAGGISIAVAAAPTLAFAAEQAGNGGIDPTALQWDKEADVVVAGFGFAGTSAALGAAAEGASVIVLEKAPEADCGGNSSSCCGGALTPDPEMMDMAHEFIRYQTTENVSDEEIDAFLNELLTTKEWLDSIGAEYFEVDSEGGSNYSILPTARSIHMILQGAGLGYGLHAHIKSVVEANENIEVMYETPACKLVYDPSTKEVFGVIALDSEGNILRIKARKGVVLACGGFENNPSMLNAYYPCKVPYAPAGAPYNTGDGIEMLGEVGAKMRGFSSVELLCHGCKAASEEIGAFCGFMFWDLEIWNKAIMVNDQGKRFVNEATGNADKPYLRPCHSKAQLPELEFSMQGIRYTNLPMFLITDDARVKSGPIFNSCMEDAAETFVTTHNWYTWSGDNQAEIDKGWVVKADTIEELAEKLGIDPAGLAEQVAVWNAAVDAGEDGQFGRTNGMGKVEVGPFYGTELNLGILNTQGGAVRDGQHRVVTNDGGIVPRLYTAGELGSTFDWLYMGAGNVPEALAGRYAGKYAAQLEDWA